MLFNSIDFLIFFPIVTLLYFVIPFRWRYLWLLLASYYFYMCWNPKYALLMATSTAITWASGLLIDQSNKYTKNKKQREYEKKLWVALSFILNLSILFFFKYFDFAIENINRVLAVLNIALIQPSFDVLLPVGISFYTFQALSYTMDIYRGEIYAEKNILKYALFVSFFPQLVAGPIERSKNLLVQLNQEHHFDYERVKRGLQLMLWGFFMKLVIADRVAMLVDQVYNNWEQYAGMEILVATVFFAIQIYCDFNSYSTIAVGAAQVMGFKLMENFRQPYFAISVADFWRRWHISLSSWFRDYLYIPLGGNRKGKTRKYINTMIVFLTSGLWHGASWNFVVWGGLNGIYQVIGEVTKPYRDKVKQLLKINTQNSVYRVFQLGITFVLINITWVFFRASSFTVAMQMLGKIITTSKLSILFDGTLFTLGLDQKDFAVALIAIGILWIVDLCHSKKISLREWISKKNIVCRWICYYAAIFVVLIFGIYGPGYDAAAFIYFQF